MNSRRPAPAKKQQKNFVNQRRGGQYQSAALVVLLHLILIGLWIINDRRTKNITSELTLPISLPVLPPPEAAIPARPPKISTSSSAPIAKPSPKRTKQAAAPGFAIVLPPDFSLSAPTNSLRLPSIGLAPKAATPQPTTEADRVKQFLDKQNRQNAIDTAKAPDFWQGVATNPHWLDPNCHGLRAADAPAGGDPFGSVVCTPHQSLESLKQENDRDAGR